MEKLEKNDVLEMWIYRKIDHISQVEEEKP